LEYDVATHLNPLTEMGSPPWLTLIPVTVIAIIGIVFIALGLPLMRRRVPLNWKYGVRIAATLADESIWYDVNARSGRDLVVLGATLIGAAVVEPVLFASWRPERHVLSLIGILVAGVTVLATRAGLHARRLWRVRHSLS
jgi:hypothetical protein